MMTPVDNLYRFRTSQTDNAFGHPVTTVLNWLPGFYSDVTMDRDHDELFGGVGSAQLIDSTNRQKR